MSAPLNHKTAFLDRDQSILSFNEREVLEGAGRVSHKQAVALAEAQYEEFAARRRALLEAEGQVASMRDLEAAAKTLPQPKKP